MTKGVGDDRSPVAPVDLSQAIIGPGMAVFLQYTAVLEAYGSTMSVRTALQLINRCVRHKTGRSPPKRQWQSTTPQMGRVSH